MIVRHLDEIVGTENDVQAETWYSRRLLLSRDGMGFSLHDTVMKAGTVTPMWYKHHLEAVYCIEGEGEIEVIGGAAYPIRTGTMYALNLHDKHVVRARTQLRMICVFNPPVTGQETHDAEGAYPPAEQISKGVEVK